jgi:tetratricopeptide (TPR) repeat protein
MVIQAVQFNRQPFFNLSKIFKYIAICLVMSGTVTRANSQYPAADVYSTILRQILSLQFESADNLITGLGSDPDVGPEIIYLRNYLEFFDALIEGDLSGYQRYMSGSLARLDSIQSGYGRLSDHLSLMSAIHLQSSFLNVLHGDNFKAARNFYVAKRYFRQAESARPGDHFNDKLEGLINLMAGSVPAEYHWLMRIFGIRGDMLLGLDQLEAYHEASAGTDRLESCLILLYARQITGLATREENDECGADTLTLLRYFHAYHALKSGNSQEVIQLLDAWRQEPGEISLAYLDLLLGEALLNGTDPGAGGQLIRFLDRTHGENFVKTAWHKLSWHHFLAGDSAAYQVARENVIEKGNLILDADIQAFREASEDGPPNAILLRSRLYFDGGYYRKSFETLQKINPGDLASRKDSLEYTYRRARIADRLGATDEAISGYHEVIQAGTGSSGYFPSNAALHLGMIYEEMGDTARALDSYRTCLELNRSAYRGSIGNKAKGSINRLK